MLKPRGEEEEEKQHGLGNAVQIYEAGTGNNSQTKGRRRRRESYKHLESMSVGPELT